MIAYLVGVGVFLLWTFFNVYHLVKYGLFDFTGKLNAFIFTGFTIVIFVLTALLLKDTPWFESVEVFKIFSADELFNKGAEMFDENL
jgi:hypothetical protein